MNIGRCMASQFRTPRDYDDRSLQKTYARYAVRLFSVPLRASESSSHSPIDAMQHNIYQSFNSEERI
jgi:hypothetical protein